MSIFFDCKKAINQFELEFGIKAKYILISRDFKNALITEISPSFRFEITANGERVFMDRPEPETLFGIPLIIVRGQKRIEIA